MGATTQPEAVSASTHGNGRRSRRLCRHRPMGTGDATRCFACAQPFRTSMHRTARSNSNRLEIGSNRIAAALNFQARAQSEVERRHGASEVDGLMRRSTMPWAWRCHVAASRALPFARRRINCLHNRRLGWRTRQCRMSQLSVPGDKSCRNPAFFGASRRLVPAILTHRIHAPLPAPRSSSPPLSCSPPPSPPARSSSFKCPRVTSPRAHICGFVRRCCPTSTSS